MLYVLCDRHGDPLKDGKQISESSPKLDAAQEFVMQDQNGSNVNGFLLTIEGSVFRAVSGSRSEPRVLEPETKDEIHISFDIEAAEKQDEEDESSD